MRQQLFLNTHRMQVQVLQLCELASVLVLPTQWERSTHSA
jgi:hypothetical protein